MDLIITYLLLPNVGTFGDALIDDVLENANSADLVVNPVRSDDLDPRPREIEVYITGANKSVSGWTRMERIDLQSVIKSLTSVPRAPITANVADC